MQENSQSDNWLPAVATQRRESTSSGSSEDSVTSKTEGLPSMSLPGENHQKEDWSYYYALYHMLAHWAAFLTIFVLLVTLGVLWNTVQTPRVGHPWGATLGLVVLCGVELRLTWCIFQESSYLLRKLPLSAREPELVEVLHKHGTLSFWVVGLGAAAFTLWDISLVLGWW